MYLAWLLFHARTERAAVWSESSEPRPPLKVIAAGLEISGLPSRFYALTRRSA